MDTLKVTQKIMRTSTEVIVMGVVTRKGERILEFCAAMNMTVGNILFKKRANLLITYKSGPLNSGRLFAQEKPKKVFKRYKSLT